MSDFESTTSGLVDGIRKNARLAVIVGVVMLVCGALSIASPLVAGISVTVVVGTFLIIGGISQCFLAFQAGAFGQGLLIFLTGALTTVVGLYLFNQPLAGLEAITLFLAAYFIVSGIVELISAMQIRPSEGWGSALLNGLVTGLLGIMIWRQFPVSGAWAVGILFGIKLIFSGMSLIVIGRSVRGSGKDAHIA
jgi:uncharacterized membrane protein HdeD (DUF308 family)